MKAVFLETSGPFWNFNDGTSMIQDQGKGSHVHSEMACQKQWHQK